MCVRQWSTTAALVALMAAIAPRSASADWVFTPFLGVNFGGSADVSGNGGVSTVNKFEHKIDYGASLAVMGKGIVGAEVDFGYSPNFFANTAAPDFQLTNGSNVTTFMGNLIVGAPAGGNDKSVRPYAVGGVGLVRTNVGDVGDVFTARSKNDFGFDAGGGLMGFFNQNVGLRGDVRYIRSFRGSESGSLTGLALSNFHYWRASVGVSFKF
jgi:hypothetical protein